MIFALARFGGLRIPSEALALRWDDIDWAQGRMTVTVPKLEHVEGKETRLVPLFPELLPYLEEGFEAADDGAEFVIARHRDKNSNLRTHMFRIIKKAGLTPWPKPFQNCRSTRETELAETIPAHVVCAWIGNSEAVAKKHYLQVTDSHFARAIEPALQNAVQQGTPQSIALPREKSKTAQRGSVRLGAARCGAKSTPGRNRTCDLRFRKPSLYPLSYGGQSRGATPGRRRYQN
jgi:integrase